MIGTCRSCHAPVWWVLTEKGKRAPIDPAPTPDGNIEVDVKERVCRVVPAAEREGRTDLHKNHFSTCPSAGQWKSGKGGARG